ncbi:hypothetical protein [Methylococcus sp. EFPC2]|uniref:hypothetical protein n=1 Tax=Methylococcus sp. EFPC2 TaxID=2812648 RepID=UPI001967F9E3|nr:hypothetical protein [Methylococcus sp. EFPC2]QSA96253.1 hypothetical protein JWZ97_13590 [Methylococcus sp. EFPC2]
MALSSKALQKKRAKKAAKRKEVRKVGAGQAGLGLATEWLTASKAPVADVLVPTRLFETGLGSIWISRRLPNGSYAISLFLLDTWCLGVKNAMAGIDSEEDYRARLEEFKTSSDEEFVELDAAYVRKLVEAAEAYGRKLGFQPHPDYKLARMLFGDVDASDCPVEFFFGRDGQPFYAAGPGDSPTVQRRILKQLEKSNQDPLGLLAGRLDVD